MKIFIKTDCADCDGGGINKQPSKNIMCDSCLGSGWCEEWMSAKDFLRINLGLLDEPTDSQKKEVGKL